MDKASIAIAKIMRLTEYVIRAGIARERSKTYFAVKEQLVAFQSAAPASVIGLLGTLAEAGPASRATTGERPMGSITTKGGARRRCDSICSKG